MTAEEKLAAIEKLLKAEGYESVEALISAFQSETAERKKAEEARDKFKESNDELRESVREKGGGLKSLEEQIRQLKEENESLRKGQEVEGKEELKEVEESLTDDQWKIADEMLEKMDDETAITYAEDTKTRLEFLKGLRDDPRNAAAKRPKSFRKTQEKKSAEEGEMDAYNALLKRLGRAPVGPSSSGGLNRSKGAKAPEENSGPAWLHGN
jgi:TolA-binding protein